MSKRRRRPERFVVFYPAFHFPRWVGTSGQVAIGRLGRWLGLALGLVLVLPAFIGGLLFLPMHILEWHLLRKMAE